MKSTRMMHALVSVAVAAWVLLAPLCVAENLKSRVKMKHSNPVLPVLVDGRSVRLILTTGSLLSRSLHCTCCRE